MTPENAVAVHTSLWIFTRSCLKLNGLGVQSDSRNVPMAPFANRRTIAATDSTAWVGPRSPEPVQWSGAEGQLREPN
jgi:hypothetical protein